MSRIVIKGMLDKGVLEAMREVEFCLKTGILPIKQPISTEILIKVIKSSELKFTASFKIPVNKDDGAVREVEKSHSAVASFQPSLKSKNFPVPRICLQMFEYHYFRHSLTFWKLGPHQMRGLEILHQR